MGVITSAGHTATQRTRKGASSSASDLVSRLTPPLEAVYTAVSGVPTTPASELRLMMQPSVFLRCGIAWRQQKNVPLRFTPRTLSHSSSVVWSLGPSVQTPAVLTTTSTRPASGPRARAVSYTHLRAHE